MTPKTPQELDVIYHRLRRILVSHGVAIAEAEMDGNTAVAASVPEPQPMIRESQPHIIVSSRTLH